MPKKKRFNETAFQAQVPSNNADSIPWPTTPRFAVVNFVIGSKKIPGLANIKGIHCIHRFIDQRRYAVGGERLKTSEMSEINGMTKLMKNHGSQVNLSRTHADRPCKTIIEPYLAQGLILLAPRCQNWVAIVIDEDK